ncbi:DUF2961 domain-containing protein [Rhizobium calliandrae]|uniref:DUF2961 domain-containing protein n=1 Tax=Rhizobium calliandrae TaxID=1312182 RepID=UPI0032E3C972
MFAVSKGRRGTAGIGQKATLTQARDQSAPGAIDAWPPTLHGTGTEDYLNTAWCPTQDYGAPFDSAQELKARPRWR